MKVCSHRFHDCPHPGYVRCVNCGSYKSCVAPPPAEVYTADYWSHERGHSTLAEQVYNCESHLENGKSKNQFVLDLIDVEDRSAALEIGCAPGALVGRLKRDAGFTFVDGIEVTLEWEGEMRRIAGAVPQDGFLQGSTGVCFWHGVFPHVNAKMQAGLYSLIVACDVFEHSHKPWPFLAECARLLRPGGQLILMLPIIRDRYEMPERMWNATEHVWLHSESNLRALLDQAGFGDVKLSQWTAGHDTVSARYVGAPVSQLRAA